MGATQIIHGLFAAALAASVAGCGSSPRVPEFDEGPTPERYSYLWDHPDDAYLAELRGACGSAVPPEAVGDDLATLVALTRWTHGRWEHDAGHSADPGDALSILRAAADGERFRCVEYAQVLAGCLSAHGIRTRQIWLTTADVETRKSGAGHLVVEAWLPDRGVWAMSDPQFGVVPLAGGGPLTAVGLLRAMASQEEKIELRGVETEKSRYLGWIRPYLYHFAFYTDCRTNPPVRGGYRVMLVPLGMDPPTVFQGVTPIEAVFTRSLTAVYAPPNVIPPSIDEMIRRGRAPVRQSGGHVFSVHYPGAIDVHLAGAFNDWDPEATPMVDADGDGVWVAMVDLPPGRHEYKFVADEAVWIDDPNASEFVGDGHLGRNSVVVVDHSPGSATNRTR